MGRRFVDMRTIQRRMQFKDDRINRALRKDRAMTDRAAALAPLSPTAPPVTAEHLELIKHTIAKDATPAELDLFLYDCARQGIHPLDRLIHFTKRSNKYTPVTSIDFLRTRAAESNECAGIDEPIFTGTPKSPHFAATVTVYRLVQGQRYPFTATARWSEYVPDQAFMWQKMPHTMLGKCAEALALRKAFPKQLTGLYVNEEMEQAAPKVPLASAPRHVTRGASEPGPAEPGSGAAAVPAEVIQQVPEAWQPFITDPLPHPPIRGHIVEGKRSKGGTKITAVLDTGEQVVTLDPEIGAQVISLKAAHALVEIHARVTGVGNEITSIAEVDEPPFNS